MTDIKRPRRGSMGFRPRKRSVTQNININWQCYPEKRLIGVPGYKVGMTHVSYVDDSESVTKGQEIVSAATVIEVPPVTVYGLRYYDNMRSLGDEFTVDEKVLKLAGVKKKKELKIQPGAKDIRLLVFINPSKTGFGKKHIEKMELGFGGKDIDEKTAYAKELLGKDLCAKDVFKSGEYVDIAAVTKGKGWQGAVKRFGVATQRPKSTGKKRHVGTLGQWHPNYVLYTAPQAGQTGYHRRTELNKRVLKIGEKPEEINPSSGFPNYGFVKNSYILIKGSVPGPAKRLVKLRLALRMDAGNAKELQMGDICLDSK